MQKIFQDGVLMKLVLDFDQQNINAEQVLERLFYNINYIPEILNYNRVKITEIFGQLSSATCAKWELEDFIKHYAEQFQMTDTPNITD